MWDLIHPVPSSQNIVQIHREEFFQKPAEKLKLIRILAEDLDTTEDISPLEPFKTYDLHTSYDSFGAGAILMANLSVPQT